MLTLPSVLQRTAQLFGSQPAIYHSEGHYTWAEFVDRVARAAGVLQRLGLQPGERFGIIGRNSFRQAELMYAAYWMGTIPVPVNYRLAAPEIGSILDDAECRLLVVADEFAPLIEDGALSAWHDRTLYLAAQTDDVVWPQYEGLMATTEPIPPRECAEDDDALLLYTGATTGRAKGVRLSHRNIVSSGLQNIAAMQIRPDDIYLHVGPMFHSGDLRGTALTMAGGAHAFLPAPSGQAVLEAIERYRATVVTMVPTIVMMTLQEPDFQTYDLSSLRLLQYGGSPMAVDWIRRAVAQYRGVEIQQVYGLTETSPVLTVLDGEDHRQALEIGEYGVLKAAGRPLIGVDIRIVDDDGHQVEAGQPGEVTVRGPNVTGGHLNLPEENQRAFQHGWFHTGDVGRVDAAGYLYVMGRKKEVVITGGENVYTSEVEAVLHEHPKVHEAAVVGVPDERFGEALFAVIVPAPGSSITEEEVISHCRGKIGGYKIPRRMAFVDEMPRSALGKVLKSEIQRIYGSTDDNPASDRGAP